MPAIFSVEITIAATVYVLAEDEDEAIRAVRAFDQNSGELPAHSEIIDGLPVSGARFGDPDFPTISISPAITVHASDCDAYFVEEVDADSN